MALLDRIAAARQESKKLLLQVNDGSQTTLVIPAFPGGQPHLDGAMYPDASYQSTASNGYGRNELVYACIGKRAENLPQSTLRMYPSDGGEALEDHRLRRLLAEPNPVTTEFEFFELSVTYLDLAGNCYWLIQRSRDGLPAELWPLRPDLIRIFPTSNPRFWSYGYVLDPTASTVTREDIIPIPVGDLIHVKYPNPLDQYFGMPPMRAAARAVSLDNAATDFVDTLLRNYAVPGVAITTAEEINQEVANRLKAQWVKSFSGANAGAPVMLQAGMTVQPLSMNLHDLELPDSRAETESRICAVFNVPPILVGAKVGLDRSTFTNYGEARRQLWEEAIFSLQRRFGDAVRRRLLPEFLGVGRARVIPKWDNSEVIALQESETAKWDRAANALARGAITINDFRRTVGLDPVPGGDVFLTPAGVVPTPADELGVPIVPTVAVQAASYADNVLVELARKRPRELVNGHNG